MNDKINSIVEELTKQGYFKTGNEIKRYSKIYGGFESVATGQFRKILAESLTSEQVFHNWSKIAAMLPVFPGKEWWNYQDYMKVKDEPSFKEVLNRFLDTQYKQNQKKKTGPVNLNRDPFGIGLEDIMQVLINNDIFVDRVYYGYGFFKYDLDNEEFIPVTEDNFIEYINITNKQSADILFRKAKNNPTYKITNLNGLVMSFDKAKNRDLTIKRLRPDYEYIINLKESFKV